MARPLTRRYFGNANTLATTALGQVGGQGVASVTLGGTNNSSGYTQGTAVTFGSPNIANGQTATGYINVTSGGITSITVTFSGTGYTSAPSVTVTGGTQGTLTLTAVLTSIPVTSIVCQGITSGTTNRTAGNDIIKQVSTSRYKIVTQDGTAICQLKASAPSAAGEMAIVATDSASGTYYVTKLTARKAVVTQGTGSQFATGAQVPWNISAAVNGVSLLIPTA